MNVRWEGVVGLVKSYIVEYWEADKDQNTKKAKHTDSWENSVLLEKLIPGVTYNVAVKTMAKNGKASKELCTTETLCKYIMVYHMT